MLQSQTYSVIVQCTHTGQTDTMQLRVKRADSGEQVHLNDATFLLRISIDNNAALIRCLIRHLTSGRESYIQSSTQLQAFVISCLLSKNATAEVGSTSTEQATLPEQPSEESEHSTDDTSS
jgi:hypothetical protein